MGRSANRLAEEKSPYLLQHAHNPVDWHPWGAEAFERARAEDKPVFLSIGYATCHWCHVMERESFEDEQVAALLNDGFVSVKVDREERPDVDGVYMTACQLLSGHGGWPLTVALTPDKRPFFAGTYFPKESRGGRIGLLELLRRLRAAWDERRGDVLASAERITAALHEAERRQVAGLDVGEPGGRALGEEVLRRGFETLERGFDELQGGFGRAPKFPTPHRLLFLLRWHDRSGDERALELVDTTLRAMRRGGIFDHVGFGFHRYSTDARWLLPHFEKMLYDQALHAMAYTEAWLVTGDPHHRRVAGEVLEYVLRDLRDAAGGFHSAEDADSEGREGTFYLWTVDELEEVLGEEDARLAREAWNCERRGNFAEEATGERTGENVLHLRRPLEDLAADLARRGILEVPAAGAREAEADGGSPEGRDGGASHAAAALGTRLASIRARLFEAREARPRPLKDDKVLTDWNGLMIAALALAGRGFGEERYVRRAVEAAEFLLAALRDGEGRLLHRWRDGEAAIPGTAADHACLAWGLVELHAATFDPRWLRGALELADELEERFRDPEGGGYFTTAADASELPVRQKEVHDGAVPSANAVAWLVHGRLARLTGDPRWEERADAQEAAFASAVASAPAEHAMWLVALDARLGPAHEVVVAGPRGAAPTRRLLDALRSRFLPRTAVLFKPTDEDASEIERLAPFTRPYAAPDEGAAAWVCTDFACRAPTSDPDEMIRALTDRPGGAS